MKLVKFIKVDAITEDPARCFEIGDKIHTLIQSDAGAFAGPYTSYTSQMAQNELFNELGVITSSSSFALPENVKMYITPEAEVPRYKLKDLKEKNNISIVRDPGKADLIVISKNQITQSCSNYYGSFFLERTDFVNLLQSIQEENIVKYEAYPARYRSRIRFSTENIQLIINSINNLSPAIEKILINYGDKDKLISFCDQAQLPELKFTNINSVDQFDLPSLEKIMNHKGKTVITDSVMQGYLGESTIDYDHYKFIDQLLGTSDPGNIELGLTLMANCNFEKSQVYLMVLLSDHYEKHRYNAYTKTVSFKSLITYMNFGRYINYTYDNILNKADELGQVDDNLKSLIMSKYKEDHEKMFTKYKWIKLGEITISKPNDSNNSQGGN